MNRPPIAPVSGDITRRALVLSGGGVRVAWQMGAVLGLWRSGLRFDFIDATSGGGLNAAMLMSGLDPVEACARWGALPLKDFLAVVPFREHFDAGGMIAFGDGRGIRERVLPALGVDLPSIAGASGVTAWWNVLDYGRKVVEQIPAATLDADWLVAGMSLPMLLPPLQRGGRTWLDAAFVRDANPIEAIRRGADEIWILWCLGNTDQYRGGFLHLYVQMLEMAANGSLIQDLERIAEINSRRRAGEVVFGSRSQVTVHIIRPDHALPLDPDLFLGSIDLATLIDMGCRDAGTYLSAHRPEGVPLEPETLQMTTPRLGISFRETMTGGFALGPTEPLTGEAAGKRQKLELSMHATVAIHDLDAFLTDPDHAGSITGHIDFPPLGMAMPSTRGVFNLFAKAGDPKTKFMVYEFGFRSPNTGRDYYLAGHKDVHDDPGLDLWKDTTTLFTLLHEGVDAKGPVVGAGVLHLSLVRLLRMIPTMNVTNARNPVEKAAALARFGKFFGSEVYDTYVKPAPSEGSGQAS